MIADIRKRIDLINNGEIPEGYKKTKIGIVPEEWKKRKFNSVFEEVSDNTNELESYPLYSLTIEDGVVPKTEKYERGFLVTKEDYNYKIVRNDEFVYNPMNVRFGAVARYSGAQDVSVSGYYNIFKVRDGFNSIYLEKFILTDRMMYIYNTVATGTLKEKRRVYFSQFLDFKLPLPSQEEQDRIAEILEDMDKLIKLKGDILNNKNLIKKGIAQRLLSGSIRVGDFKEDWVKVDLEEVFEFHKKDAVQNPENYRLLTVKLHLNGIEATNKYPKVTEKGRPYYNREPGELLIGRQNFHNGGIGIVPDDMVGYVASNAISSLKSKYGNLRFYYYYISSPNFYKKVGHLIGGTGQKEVSENMLKKLKLVIPKDIDEQNEIVNILDDLDKEIQLLEEEKNKLEEEKKLITNLLLTGIVRVV